LDPAGFFIRNIILVYFFYGLSFFMMGLAVYMEVGRSSEFDFAKALRPLAGFGLLHGSHEWFEMFLLIYPDFAAGPSNTWIAILRVVLLASSFLLLILFGVSLISGPTRPTLVWGMMSTVVAIWGIGLFGLLFSPIPAADRLVSADVYTRYALAIPGAALTVWGLILQRRKFNQPGMQRFRRDMLAAAVAFGFYGGIGQLFASSSTLFPSDYLNAELFFKLFGFPVQVLRAAMAIVAAVFIIDSLRIFEFENQRQLETMREEQLAERRRLEATRAELLHRTVKAQESERQRIARELHDETGQTLTALGMGLRGLSDTIPNNPQRAAQQAKQLELLAGTGLEELQRLVGGLHPPQLDDLGLLAALRWYATEIQNRYGLALKVTTQGEPTALPPEVRVVLFRISQEAITNVVRHANAQQASICLEYNHDQINLYLEDDGIGFDVESTLRSGSEKPCWGLLGLLERASLVGGECQIKSRPGAGTLIIVNVPLEPQADV
jgi:signal transduction histidine kinase